MIISPPFLPPQPGHEMDSADAGNTIVPHHDVCAAGMQECAPGNGAYPVSFNLGWHGGSHFVAPKAANGHSESVRAIADGTVVYVRQTSPEGTAALQYRDVRTDDGCVVIKHSTEIGEGDDAKATYFSVYMHLQTVVVSPTAVGKKIYRKDVLGVPGQIYGQLGQIHFEIVCNDANLKKLIGRVTGPLNAAQGRVDAIYGDIWFKVPKGAKIFGNQPHPYRGDASESPLGPHPSVQMQQPIGITSSDLFIRMHYEKTCTLTTFRLAEDGRSIQVGEPLSSTTTFEYDLYTEVNRLNRMYTDGSTAPANPSPKAPSPSLIYAMLRFGRPVSETMPSDVKFAHWRRVVTPEGTGWINLHRSTTIGVYSDADFPHWAGWSLIDDDSTPESHCDSPTITKWLDLNGDGHVTHAEAKAALHNNDVAKRMAQAICKFPIEWTRQNIEGRWGWVLTQNEALPAPLSKDDFTVLQAHIEALAFWEDIHDAELPPAAGCWHFPPKAFVEHFRKCGWRSLRELTQTLPRRSSNEAGGNILWSTAKQRWCEGNTHHGVMPANMNVAINRMWAKYGFSSVQRQAHFLAQIFKETGALQSTVERGDDRYFCTMYEILTPQEAGDDFDHKHHWLEAMGFLKGRNRQTYMARRPDEIQQKAVTLGNTQPGDGPRFRGRGLIHLTGRGSYKDYGKYCSRDFTTDPNPQLLSTEANAVADSAGYFWISKVMQSPNTGALRSGMNIHRRADVGTGEANVAAITTPVNGASNGLPERKEFFRYVYFILGDTTSLPPGFVKQVEDQ
ncbi:hypothetical protein PQQ52_05855 [Paraburkholderia sediminicola]|uniref:hypothetical protein n=1 Tax=Paraburkholderia sediminicola TaxID=458836 RepID=UPI0038B90AB2